METYNGYANRETWLLHIIMDVAFFHNFLFNVQQVKDSINDEVYYKLYEKEVFVEALKDYANSFVDVETDFFKKELLKGALLRIDYNQVAEKFIEESNSL